MLEIDFERFEKIGHIILWFLQYANDFESFIGQDRNETEDFGRKRGSRIFAREARREDK
jgi:hypothetical protein